MIKNVDNKGILLESINNSNDFNSTAPSTMKKKQRKDANGNLILKKKIPVKKTKYHVNYIDNVIPGKELVNIIEIESYKRYNLNDEDIEEEPEAPHEEKLEDNNIVTSHKCCSIF